MSKKKTAKRAFISSLLVLAMCFTMLAGTTFAWFTDSVTSSTNIIRSGKLDMVLETSTDLTTWTEVTATTKLFDDTFLFEPGAVEVAYVRVKNAGDLAFTYKLGAIVGTEISGINQAGNTFKLSDYLQFAVAETAAAYADRAAAIAAIGAATSNSLNAFGGEGNLLKGETTAPQAIIIYMPDTVGNEANYGSVQPSITLGITAVAKQYTYESDSFNDQYDVNAEYPTGSASATTPEATVTEIAPAAIGNNGELVGTYSGDVVSADAGFNFGTNETLADIEGKPYEHYKVDFIVSFNKPIAATDAIYLFGAYDGYNSGAWTGDKLGMDLAAGAELRIIEDWLSQAISGVTVDYTDVVTLQSFKSAIAVEDATLQSGLVATVKLVMNDGTQDIVVDTKTVNL